MAYYLSPHIGQTLPRPYNTTGQSRLLSNRLLVGRSQPINNSLALWTVDGGTAMKLEGSWHTFVGGKCLINYARILAASWFIESRADRGHNRPPVIDQAHVEPKLLFVVL